MKVLLVSEYYPPIVMGGGEINAALVAKALSKQGVKVSVLTSFQEGLPAEEEGEGITIYRRLRTASGVSSLRDNLWRSMVLPRSVVREVKKIHTQYDLIHFLGTSVLAAPKLKVLGKPLWATVESYPALCPKGDRIYHGKTECTIRCSAWEFIRCQRHAEEIGKMKNKAYLKYNPVSLGYIYHYYQNLHNALHSCHLIAISSYVQALLLQHGLQSVVVPNIIESERFQGKKKSNENNSNENSNKNSNKVKRILYLGSLTRYKGAQVLGEAMKGLPRELPFQCDFYGDGPVKEELEQIPGVQVHPLVPQEQVPRLYAHADVVVFPSLWPEPFGRIPAEAMASGTLVIASDVGAIPEIVSPETGILVSPGKVEELCQAIQRVLHDVTASQRMAIRGRKRVRELYSSEVVGKKLQGVYQAWLK